MSLASIFEGDITLEQGSDISQFGWGDLTTNRKIIINGTEDSTGAISYGSLLVNGGGLINKSLYVNQTLNVLYNTTYLTETDIDTTNGKTTIHGVNSVDISVGDSSNFISTNGNILIESLNNNLLLNGGYPGTGAIKITATNTQGGIMMKSGISGDIQILSGDKGINLISSSGNISSISENASSNYIVNSYSNNQDLSIELIGKTNSQLKIQSEGLNDSILINNTNTAGNILISNFDGLSKGYIKLLTGSSGYNLLTNTGGTITQLSQAASSSYLVQSNGVNQDLLFELLGETDSTLYIKSSGTNNAINLMSLSSSGNINILQTSGSLGMIYTKSGIGGIMTETHTGGSINMKTYGASSLYTNLTTNDNQNLTVSVQGNTDSKVILLSEGTSQTAIDIQTTNSGGITLNSTGIIQLQSTDTANGVKIGTTNSIPVVIGTPTSTTTILGDLYIKGNTSTVNHQVVTIDDNIIITNNSPFISSDGGIAIKRFQSANNVGNGDVVSDSATESGTVQSGSNTVSTIHLDNTANNTDNYYNGWWIKIISGTGSNQVRKIKDYDGTTKVAVLFDTSDNASSPKQPVEGLDLDTILDNTSVYNLYPCHYTMCIWDESADEFAMVCSASDVSDKTNPVFEPNISHYTNLHVNNLISNGVFTSFINNTPADTLITVTLTDNSTTPVTLTGFPNTYGIYIVFVRPVNVTTRTSAIFTIGRINVISTPGTFVRLISIKGAQNEQLSIQWTANNLPQLLYKPSPNVIGTTDYLVKICTI